MNEQNTGERPVRVIPHIGTEVTGERRFPRPDLELEFDSVLTTGNGAKLFGLRRIGKSTEAAACAERLAKQGWLIVRCDSQGMQTEAELLLDILNGLPVQGWRERIVKTISDDNAISSVARNFIKSQTGGTASDVQAYFRPIADAVRRAFETLKQKIVIIIDEFPWLCRNILEADAEHGRNRVNVLLASLRRWRGGSTSAASGAAAAPRWDTRMLLLGSIGLVGLSREYRLDLTHLNDLAPLTVPPYTREEACEFIQALSRGGEVSGWTDAHTELLIAETTAFYPSLLQRGFQQVSLGKRAASLAVIPDLFAEKVRPDLDESFYNQFDRRMQRYRALAAPLPELLDGLVTRVLSQESGASRSELTAAVPHATDADLGDALAMLSEDGFLRVRVERSGEQHWSVASGLVRAWWSIRRGATRK
jgi:hypothetical protein